MRIPDSLVELLRGFLGKSLALQLFGQSNSQIIVSQRHLDGCESHNNTRIIPLALEFVMIDSTVSFVSRERSDSVGFRQQLWKLIPCHDGTSSAS